VLYYNQKGTGSPVSANGKRRGKAGRVPKSPKEKEIKK